MDGPVAQSRVRALRSKMKELMSDVFTVTAFSVVTPLMFLASSMYTSSRIYIVWMSIFGTGGVASNVAYVFNQRSKERHARHEAAIAVSRTTAGMKRGATTGRYRTVLN
jgi:hypothetical protein